MGNTSMDYSEAHEKLKSINEDALFDHWQELSSAQQQLLLSDIQILSVDEVTKQKQFLLDHTSMPKQEASPCHAFNDYAYSGNRDDATFGMTLIAEGKVGALLIAGGQGSRLGFNGPKGTFPISLIENKSLFELFAEKVKAASLCYGRLLRLAIMTSPQNHAVTIAFFEEHNHFGLDPSQLSFFSQSEMPFLDEKAHLMLHEGTIAKGPDGNGSSLREFVRSGIWERWHSEGISYINYILIDNPLADPFDAELVGFHARNNNEMTIKCVEKAYAEESVGLIVNTNAGIKVVEYSELPDEERSSVAADGKLKHRLANISLFCLDMPFINHAASKALPWHLANKPIATSAPIGWKFETFIFDIMPASTQVKALLFPRSQTFAPLKNEKGPDSIETVKNALLQRDHAQLSMLVGRDIPPGLLELAQEFYYPTQEMEAKWWEHPGPFEGYIRP